MRFLRFLAMLLLMPFAVMTASPAQAGCVKEADIFQTGETCDYSSGEVEEQKAEYPSATWTVRQLCKDDSRTPEGVCFNPQECTTAAGVPLPYEIADGPIRIAGTPYLTAAVRTLVPESRAFYGLAVGTSPLDAHLVQNNVLPLRERTAVAPRSVRFDWGDGETRVNVFFDAKGEAKSSASVLHERLPDGEEAERMKAFWRERVGTLKEVLER